MDGMTILAGNGQAHCLQFVCRTVAGHALFVIRLSQPNGTLTRMAGRTPGRSILHQVILVEKVFSIRIIVVAVEAAHTFHMNVVREINPRSIPGRVGRFVLNGQFVGLGVKECRKHTPQDRQVHERDQEKTYWDWSSSGHRFCKRLENGRSCVPSISSPESSALWGSNSARKGHTYSRWGQPSLPVLFC